MIKKIRTRVSLFPKEIKEIILNGCPQCLFDEAEGELQDHCNKCCRRIMTWAYILLTTEN